MQSIAVRIDIATELEAMKAGQCGACRTGGTHTKNDQCDIPEFQKHYVKMSHCRICNNLYNPQRFEECPMCKEE